MPSNRQKINQLNANLEKRSTYGGWWFLLTVLMLHVALSQINPALSAESLTYSVKVLTRLLPVIGLMMVLFWLFSLFKTPRQITQFLGRQSGVKGWLIAVFGGVFSMGSLFLWFPLLKKLKADGINISLLATFLYSRALKIPMLPFMIYYFGVFYTMLFICNILLFSILSGKLMARIVNQHK